MTRTTITTTDGTTSHGALLRLLTWLSPAFPTGAFAYSHGLEWAVETGDVRDEAGLLAWLSDVLAHGSGRNDAILLRMAYAAADGDGLADVAALAAATASSRERQEEMLAQGRAFIAAASAWGCGMVADLPPEQVPYAVAVGAVSAAHGVDVDAVCTGFLHAVAANIVSAGVRLVPLGQSAGLRVLAALEPLVLAVAAETRGMGEDDLGGCTFRSDLAAMRHETQYTRLFRS